MNTDRQPTPKALCRAMSLVEVLLVLLLVALGAALLLGSLVRIQRAVHAPGVVFEGAVLPLAPSFASVPAALAFHRQLGLRLAEARAVYVFGGKARKGSLGEVVPPLARADRPVITDFSRGLPLDANGFFRAYGAELGETLASPGDADFSLLLIGPHAGELAVTCFAQTRSRAFTESGKPFISRESRLWDLRDGVLAYQFAETGELGGLPFVGAIHDWYEDAGAQGEERPASIVFPDPWVFLGSRGQPGESAPASRFLYLAGVSP